VVVIGAGHNGLVTAFYLARAGLRPLVLERRSQVGGAAVTGEFHPGFRTSLLAHSASLEPGIIRDMQLERHGLELITPEVSRTALSPANRALVLYRNVEKATHEIARVSPADARKYAELAEALRKIAGVILKIFALTPPDIASPGTRDLLLLLGVGRTLRGLGRRRMYDLLRWAPMAVADLAQEFFASEALRSVLAARGIFGASLGPWSAGTSLLFLLRAASEPNPAGGATFSRGGIGAITEAMAAAAQKAGAQIRTDAEVGEITVKHGQAAGVVLSTGEKIPARAVVSSADPKRTFLNLLDPSLLSPGFLRRVRNYRMPGTLAKVNLALAELPAFGGVDGAREQLTGTIQIGPEIDYLERAYDDSKYGNFSRAPYLEFTIPSLSDSSLAPQGKHVMSVYMQYAPYKLKNDSWDNQRQALGQTVVRTLAEYAPDLERKVLGVQVITPQDLESDYGLTGGHIFHGELALDQIFTMRPILDWARYKMPLRELYLCGSGTHPGTGLTGGSGRNAAREILRQLKRRK
jgi:phytoene dehydrogenase-like protein